MRKLILILALLVSSIQPQLLLPTQRSLNQWFNQKTKTTSNVRFRSVTSPRILGVNTEIGSSGFSQDIGAGGGWKIYKDENNDWVITIDKIDVRQTLTITEIVGLDSLNIDSLNFVPDLEFATFKASVRDTIILVVDSTFVDALNFVPDSEYGGFGSGDTLQVDMLLRPDISGGADVGSSGLPFGSIYGDYVYASAQLVHMGDTDTKIQFSTDQMDIQAGGAAVIITLHESANDYIRLGAASQDIDLYFGDMATFDDGASTLTFATGVDIVMSANATVDGIDISSLGSGTGGTFSFGGGGSGDIATMTFSAAGILTGVTTVP